MWLFQKFTAGDTAQDPNEGFFFDNNSLLREALQNSLDAAKDDESVTVKVALYEKENGLDAEIANKYFSDLKPHVVAAFDKQFPRGNVPYLVIEDFGTHGLRGSTESTYIDIDENDDSPKDFYYFFRNIGRTNKKTGERGSWGIGKAVFSSRSTIGTFFGFTIRSNEPGKKYLMGQSVLKTHKTVEGAFKPLGYFADFKDDKQLPILDNERIEQFCADFNITRSDEPGLSVVIPHINGGKKSDLLEEMIISAVKDFYSSFIQKHLALNIKTRQREVIINESTIIDVIDEFIKDEGERVRLKELIKLTKFFNAPDYLAQKNKYKFEGERKNSKPDWFKIKEDKNWEELINKIKDDYDSNKPVAIRVSFDMRLEGGEAQDAYFDLLLTKQDKDIDSSFTAIRKGMAIFSKPQFLPRSVVGMIIPGQGILSKFLSLAENPSHTKWEKSSSRTRKFTPSAGALSFIEDAFKQVLKSLNPQSKTLDRFILEDIFSLEKLDSNKKEKATEDSFIKPETKEAFCVISKLKDGLTISFAKEKKVPQKLLIECAYQIAGIANPFGRFIIYDFDFTSSHMVQVEGAECNISPNTIEVNNIIPGGSIHIRGFDTNRDVAVRIT